MAESQQYIQIMIEDLHKKSRLLDDIIDANRRLSAVIASADMDLEEFGSIVEEKGGYVDEINSLDTGFQSLFDRVKAELNGHKEQYADEIKKMQALIREVTDKSVQIQAEEEKSRLIIEGQFARKRQNLQNNKKNMNVASSYYKNMSKTNVIDSQFMDQKH